MTWPLVFAIVALILFILAAGNINHERVTLGWAGAAFLTLAFILVDTFGVVGG